jgi:hypothetical protein
MINAEPSLDAAKGLSGHTFLTYLSGKGWAARPSRVEGIYILSKRPRGYAEDVEILLPVVRQFGDELKRIADALRTVAAVEGRSEARISGDVRVLGNGSRTAQARSRKARPRSTIRPPRRP